MQRAIVNTLHQFQLSQPLSTLQSCLYWREGYTEKEQVMLLFLGKKAFSCLRMLPLKLEKWVSCGGSDYRIDEAWSRHGVPTFIEYRSQVAERLSGTVSLMVLR